MKLTNEDSIPPTGMDYSLMEALALLLSILALAAARSTDVANSTDSVKDEVAPAGTPWLPFLNLNTFSSFGLPALGFRPPIDKIKATKTEYIEVTRRQTVHPVCYTMYENKVPCLPHRSSDEEEPEMDVDIEHHISFSADIKSESAPPQANMESFMKPVSEVLEKGRNGKYLQFGPRPQIEGSIPPVRPNRHTEYVSTTTVLLTKLEKYTDHRVTATMAALNCFPVDPAIPKCRRYVVSPIIEVPLNGNKKTGSKNTIIITPVIKPKADYDEGGDIEKTVEAVKKAAEAAREEAESREDPRATEAPGTN